jgi:hypothetical protein
LQIFQNIRDIQSKMDLNNILAPLPDDFALGAQVSLEHHQNVLEANGLYRDSHYSSLPSFSEFEKALNSFHPVNWGTSAGTSNSLALGDDIPEDDQQQSDGWLFQKREKEVDEVEGFHIYCNDAPIPHDPEVAERGLFAPPLPSTPQYGVSTDSKPIFGSQVVRESLAALGGRASAVAIADWIIQNKPVYLQYFGDRKKLRYSVSGILSSRTYAHFFDKEVTITKGVKKSEWILLSREGLNNPVTSLYSNPVSSPAPLSTQTSTTSSTTTMSANTQDAPLAAISNKTQQKLNIPVKTSSQDGLNGLISLSEAPPAIRTRYGRKEDGRRSAIMHRPRHFDDHRLCQLCGSGNYSLKCFIVARFFSIFIVFIVLFFFPFVFCCCIFLNYICS